MSDQDANQQSAQRVREFRERQRAKQVWKERRLFLTSLCQAGIAARRQELELDNRRRETNILAMKKQLELMELIMRTHKDVQPGLGWD